MRLAAKTLSYGVVHVIVAASVAYALTGSWAVALSIGLLEPVVQTLVFPLHEKLWERKAEDRTQPGEGGRFSVSGKMS